MTREEERNAVARELVRQAAEKNFASIVVLVDPRGDESIRGVSILASDDNKARVVASLRRAALALERGDGHIRKFDTRRG